MRIGLVDIDTSHPSRWVPVERELGHTVAGIWDSGSIHCAAYVRDFAEQLEIPRVYDRIEQMVDDVDCAVIHSCNWDTHIEKARPFVEAGKAVLVDKPLAGNLADLKQLCKWANSGARITGGSALRFCYETRDWLAKPVEERGTPHTALSGCAVDEFNYGIHAYSMLSGIMGPGIRAVRHIGDHVQRRIQVSWADGRIGFVVVGQSANWIPFYSLIVTEKGPAYCQVDSTRLYRALLEAVLPYLSGELDKPPVGIKELIEPELAALAGRRSWMENGREVTLEELAEADAGYDGKAFAEEYKRAQQS